MAAISSIVAAVTAIAGAGAAVYSAQQQSKAAKAAKKNIPQVPAPVPKLEDMGQLGEEYLKKRRKGRADTILTGDLIPTDIGKRTLLG